jgi:hypothetical protein
VFAVADARVTQQVSSEPTIVDAAAARPRTESTAAKETIMAQGKHRERDTDEEMANPDRTQVDDEGVAHSNTVGERHGDPHDQDWGEVSDEVKKAVENADGPLP